MGARIIQDLRLRGLIADWYKYHTRVSRTQPVVWRLPLFHLYGPLSSIKSMVKPLFHLARGRRTNRSALLKSRDHWSFSYAPKASENSRPGRLEGIASSGYVISNLFYLTRKWNVFSHFELSFSAFPSRSELKSYNFVFLSKSNGIVFNFWRVEVAFVSFSLWFCIP